MGHYRSEMVSPDEDRRDAERTKERRDKAAAKIKERIEKEGIEFVLADMVTDPVLARIRYL